MSSSTLAPHEDPRSALPTDEQLAELHAMLREQRAFRVDQLTQLCVPGPHGPLSSAIPEVSDELARGARAALLEVQQALWRIEEGSYGRCVECSRPVGVQRLEVLPQAARCPGCQRAAG